MDRSFDNLAVCWFDFWRKSSTWLLLLPEILCADDGYGVSHSLFSDSLSMT